MNIELFSSEKVMKIVENILAKKDLAANISLELYPQNCHHKKNEKRVYLFDLAEHKDFLEIEDVLICSDNFVMTFGQIPDEKLRSLYEKGLKDHFGFLSEKSLMMFLEKVISFTYSRGRLDEDLIHSYVGGRSVMILGETGTGKSYLAKELFKLTNRGKFIHLNLAEIPETLIEGELFGYKKGAFTGASDSREGYLSLADGGTLFLDEIGALPLKIQKRLLKVLEEKSFYPIGSTVEKKIDFKLICATCEPLEEYIKVGKFRKDLYFRLNGYCVELDPIRGNTKKIEGLIEIFLDSSVRKVILSAESKDRLCHFDWPGNIRELKNVIDSLCLNAAGIIEADGLCEYLSSEKRKSTNSIDFNMVRDLGLKKYISMVEKSIVERMMKEYQGQVRTVQQQLRISCSSFYRIYRAT